VRKFWNELNIYERFLFECIGVFALFVLYYVFTFGFSSYDPAITAGACVSDDSSFCLPPHTYDDYAEIELVEIEMNGKNYIALINL